MYKDSNKPQWINYLETPITTGSPVKLSCILQKRLRDFMKARLEKIQELES
jgi:hypothetical protein